MEIDSIRDRNSCEWTRLPLHGRWSQTANKIMKLRRKEIGMNVVRIFQSRHPYSAPLPYHIRSVSKDLESDHASSMKFNATSDGGDLLFVISEILVR